MLVIASQHIRVGVVHYCYQHVQGSDECEARSHKEENVDEDVLLAAVITGVEASQCDQMLIDHNVDEPPARVGADHFFIFATIHAEALHSAAEHEEEEDVNCHEGDDIAYGLQDELDVETSIIEQSHPVKHLEPKTEHEQRCNDASMLKLRPLHIKRSKHDHDKRRHVLAQVHHIDEIGEVLPVLVLML